MNAELHSRLSNFVMKTAILVDRDELEAWLDCFHEESSYIVIPRENLDAGYGIGLMRCDNKAILQDRISVLRHASKFNPHWDRHILSGTHIKSEDGDIVLTSTTFMVVQTQLNGTSSLFCSGAYEDEIQVGNTLLLRKRQVTLDTFTVSNCLATPL